MSDYVTIYSTMAIISAIIIAALGLLIGNQLLVLGGMKRQLVSQVVRSDRRLEALLQEQVETNKRLQVARVQLHLEQFIIDIARSTTVPGFAEVQATHPAVDLDQDVYCSEYDRQREAILQARAFLAKHQASIGAEHSLDRWATRQGLDVSDYDLRFLDIAYDLAWRKAQVDRLRQEETVQRQRPWPWSMGTALIWPKNELALIHDLAEEADYEAESQDRLDELVNEIHMLQNRLYTLERKIPLLQWHSKVRHNELESVQMPRALGWVSGMLGALAVFGIVLPLGSILLQPTLAVLIWPVLGLFFLSLVGLSWSTYTLERAILR
jgi:hypothetical protein